MSEEEIIQCCQNLIVTLPIKHINSDALQCLLDLYNKEKEKNRKLEEILEIKKNTPEWEYQYWEARKEVYDEWRFKLEEKIDELDKRYMTPEAISNSNGATFNYWTGKRDMCIELLGKGE